MSCKLQVAPPHCKRAGACTRSAAALFIGHIYADLILTLQSYSCMRLPLKVIIGALSGVIKTDSENRASERREFEREIGQHKERRETREKPL